MESRRPSGLTKFLDEEGNQAETANCPGKRAPPVCTDKLVNGGSMISVRQFLMKRDLAQSSGSPDQAKRTYADAEEQRALTETEKQDRAADLQQHERPHNPSDHRHVPSMVGDEFAIAHVLEQGVERPLYRPDQPHQCPGDRSMNDE